MIFINLIGVREEQAYKSVSHGDSDS